MKKFSFKNSLSNIYVPGLLILSVLVFFRKIIFSGKLLFGWESVLLYFYWRSWQFTFIRNGYFPLWAPNTLSGFPFFADPMWAMFYLPNYIFALIPTYYLAMNISVIFHVILAGLGTYFYMRVISGDKLASLFSAVVFMFSGIFIGWVFFGGHLAVCTMSWLPILFLFVEKGIREGRLKYFLFLGIAISLQILAGHFQYSYYSILAVIMYFVFRVALLIKSQKWSVVKLLKYFLIALVIGVFLSAIQLVPSFYMLQHSPLRSGMDISESTIGTFPLENLLTIIAPDFFGSDISEPYWGKKVIYIFRVYLGLIPLILFLGAFFINKKNKYTIIFILETFIFSLLAIGGENNPLFMLCYKILPGFNLWRLSVRMLFISTFSLTILAGFGLSQIRQELSQNILKKRCFWVLTLLIFGLILVLLGFISYSDSGWCRFVDWVMSGGNHVTEISNLYKTDKAAFVIQAKSIAQLALLKSLILYGFAMLGIFALLNKRIKENLAKSLIIMLLFFDLSLMSGKSILTYDWKRLHFSSGIKAFFAKDKEPYRIATLLPANETLKMDNLRSHFLGKRLYNQSYINMGAFDNIDNVAGFSRILDKRYLNFVGIDIYPQGYFLINFIKNPKAVNMLNVKYYMYPKDIEIRKDYIHEQFMERTDLLLRYTDDKVSIYENPKVHKRAYMVYSLVKLNNPDRVLKLIFDKSFDPNLEAVVEADNDLSKYSTQLATDNNLYASTVKITKYLPNSVDIVVNTPKAGMLVLADNYDEGWHVYVDGQKEKIYIANYIMRGVCLNQGMHKVRFVYDPWYFKVGLILSLCGVGVLLLFFIKIRKEKP